MANTRRFGFTVRLDSGLLIPASAADGKVLTSDASGNAAWGNLFMIRPYALNGELVAAKLAGWYVPEGKRKLIKAEFSIISGTSIKFNLLKNGAVVETYKEVLVEKGVKSVTSTVAMTNGDFFNVELLTPVATPVGLSLSFFEQIGN